MPNRRGDPRARQPAQPKRRYARPAPGGANRTDAAGVTAHVAAPGDLAEALSFDRRHFPQWLRFFEEGRQSVLLARDAHGELVGMARLPDGQPVDRLTWKRE